VGHTSPASVHCTEADGTQETNTANTGIGPPLDMMSSKFHTHPPHSRFANFETPRPDRCLGARGLQFENHRSERCMLRLEPIPGVVATKILCARTGVQTPPIPRPSKSGPRHDPETVDVTVPQQRNTPRTSILPQRISCHQRHIIPVRRVGWGSTYIKSM
jgi:hypothetical protein